MWNYSNIWTSNGKIFTYNEPGGQGGQGAGRGWWSGGQVFFIAIFQILAEIQGKILEWVSRGPRGAWGQGVGGLEGPSFFFITIFQILAEIQGIL